MAKPDPIITLNRRWRILCARVEQVLRLPQIVRWLSDRLARGGNT